MTRIKKIDCYNQRILSNVVDKFIKELQNELSVKPDSQQKNLQEFVLKSISKIKVNSDFDILEPQIEIKPYTHENSFVKGGEFLMTIPLNGYFMYYSIEIVTGVVRYNNIETHWIVFLDKLKDLDIIKKVSVL
jgi:hypothetical protein